MSIDPERLAHVSYCDIDPLELHLIENEDLVAIDIETSGLDWETEQIGTVQIFMPKSHYISIVIIDPTQRPERLINILESAALEKVFHHALFDLRFLSRSWQVSPKKIACTKIAAKLLAPGHDQSHYSLKTQLRERLGIELDKSEQVSRWTSQRLSPEQVSYAARDVFYLPRLIESLRAEASSKGLRSDLRSTFNYIPIRVASDLRKCGDVFTY